MSLVVVLIVSVITTRPVAELNASRKACLRVTAMDGNHFLVPKFRAPYQLLPSLLPHRHLR